MRVFRSLRHRSFALLWSGQTLCRLGDFVYEVALAWWVLQTTGSAVTMSRVLGAPAVILISGGFTVVVALPALSHPSMRHLD
jgi:hypothetical protein